VTTVHEPLPHRSAGTNTVAALHHILHRDFESRSRLDLRKVGAHKYAAHPSTEVICCAYAVDDGPTQIWIPGDSPPPEFNEAALNLGWAAAAHGDHFESEIEKHIMGPQYGWPTVPLERHICTQALCLAAGLPAKLSAAANALELSNRKDVAGERLMHAMAKPRRPRQGAAANDMHWFDDAERLQRLYSYCKQDVEVQASSTVASRFCRRRSTHYGCSAARSMIAASV
jgi:DNA polymerase